jgi:hypothetical protein
LPNDPRHKSLAARSPQSKDRLALIGQTQGSDGPRVRGQDLSHCGIYRIQNLGRMVLDLPGPREVLGEFGRNPAHHPQVRIEEQGCDPGGTRVDGQDIRLLHFLMLKGQGTQGKHAPEELCPNNATSPTKGGAC